MLSISEQNKLNIAPIFNIRKEISTDDTFNKLMQIQYLILKVIEGSLFK